LNALDGLPPGRCIARRPAQPDAQFDDTGTSRMARLPDAVLYRELPKGIVQTEEKTDGFP
jgi:hypothetical protein